MEGIKRSREELVSVEAWRYYELWRNERDAPVMSRSGGARVEAKVTRAASTA